VARNFNCLIETEEISWLIVQHLTRFQVTYRAT